jgi:hypothetical protein
LQGQHRHHLHLWLGVCGDNAVAMHSCEAPRWSGWRRAGDASSSRAHAHLLARKHAQRSGLPQSTRPAGLRGHRCPTDCRYRCGRRPEGLLRAVEEMSTSVEAAPLGQLNGDSSPSACAPGIAAKWSESIEADEFRAGRCVHSPTPSRPPGMCQRCKDPGTRAVTSRSSEGPLQRFSCPSSATERANYRFPAGAVALIGSDHAAWYATCAGAWAAHHAPSSTRMQGNRACKAQLSGHFSYSSHSLGPRLRTNIRDSMPSSPCDLLPSPLTRPSSCIAESSRSSTSPPHRIAHLSTSSSGTGRDDACKQLRVLEPEQPAGEQGGHGGGKEDGVKQFYRSQHHDQLCHG